MPALICKYCSLFCLYEMFFVQILHFFETFKHFRDKTLDTQVFPSFLSVIPTANYNYFNYKTPYKLLNINLY